MVLYMLYMAEKLIIYQGTHRMNLNKWRIYGGNFDAMIVVTSDVVRWKEEETQWTITDRGRPHTYSLFTDMADSQVSPHWFVA